MGPLALGLGFAADRLLGDPRRWHPVAGFGRAAAALERLMWRPSRTTGAAYVAVLVTAVAAPVALVDRRLGRARPLFGALVLWTALGGRSLERAALELADAVGGGDIARARALAPALVGRDPASLGADGLARAAVESVAENTSDAVVATLVWAIALGPAGAAGHRAVNTLDAMVGHRSPRHAAFGWAAARLDDLANWPAARATALAAALLAPRRTAAWRWARRRARNHPSPNAGLVEAAFAAALGLRLGGPTAYRHGAEARPVLDAGPAPTAADVRRAVALAGTVQRLLLCTALAVRA
jgi:adenosylcobinamide-phosphate synthase